MDRFSWYFVFAGAVFFFGTSIVILAGDVIKRAIYAIFLVQFSLSFFVPFAFYITLAGMMLLPPVLLLSKKFDKIDTIPCRKSMSLILSGWLIALVYSNLFCSHKYFLSYDISMLLGFGIAYAVFFLLKTEILDADRIVRYTMLSGLFFVGMVSAGYIAKGHALEIFSGGRFGMRININPNLVAFYINMTFPCAFFVALFERQHTVRRKFLYAIAAVLAGIVVITGARGALLGIVAAVIYFLWHKRSLVWTLGTFACLGVVIITMGRKYLVRLLSPSSAEIISDLGRLELLKAAFKILKDNYFFFGIGTGSFSRLKMEYGIPVWFPAPGEVENLSSHNTYVEMWLSWGILGLIGWLTFNFGIIYTLLRYNGERYNGAAKAVAFAMLSLMLYGFVDCNTGNFALMFTYFSLAGTALYIMTLSKTGAERRLS